MIRVVATLTINPDKFEEVMTIATELVRLTREEKGCVNYDLVQSIEEAHQLALIEAWETKEDLDAHCETEHFLELLPQIGTLCSEEPTISVFNQII